jgi:hypothetical protein
MFMDEQAQWMLHRVLSIDSRLSFATEGSSPLFISTAAGTDVELDISSLTKLAITSNSSSQRAQKMIGRISPSYLITFDNSLHNHHHSH